MVSLSSVCYVFAILFSGRERPTGGGDFLIKSHTQKGSSSQIIQRNPTQTQLGTDNCH